MEVYLERQKGELHAQSHNPPQPRKQPRRGLSRYKRSETTRLLRSAQDAGLTVTGIEADPATGVLRLLVGKPYEPGDSAIPGMRFSMLKTRSGLPKHCTWQRPLRQGASALPPP